MALVLGDNFSYQGSKPLDARLKYDTVANMKAVADATMYDGCMAYCAGTDKTYQWKSTNTVDETLGKWREFTSGGGGTDYTAGDGIDITNDVISTKQSETGDIDEIVDKYPAKGNLITIENAFNKGDIYSTDEKMIGQWIDGKPIYRITINFGSLPSNTSKEVAHGISNLDNIFNINGFAYGASAEQRLPLPNINPKTAGASIGVTVNVTNIVVTTGMDRSVYTNSYITFDYTKTTDTAISIGSETEYSTDEKVVGTWIDGKPLYQRTFHLTNPSTNWTANSLNVVVDKVFLVNAYYTTSAWAGGCSTYYNTSTNMLSILAYKATTTNIAEIWIKGSSTVGAIADLYVTLQYTKA